MSQERRSVTRRLLVWINILVANAAVLVCVLTFVSPTVLRLGPVLPEYMGLERVLVLPLRTPQAWAVFLGALGLVLANVAWLLRRQRPDVPLRYVLSQAPGGAVRISRDALEAGLRAAGEALPEITRVRMAVETGGPRRVVVHCQFQCPEGISNLAASQLLRDALMRRFGEMVRPIEGTRIEYEIEFVGFAGKLTRRPAEEPKPKEPEPAPFTGPLYPIDDEEGAT